MSKIKITIPGTPMSVNHYLGNVVMGKRVIRYKTKRAKDYQKLIKTLYDGKLLEGKLKMSIHLFFGTRHKHDIDNYNKTILDSLNGVAYEDDNQIKRLFIERHYDKKNPRVEVEVEEIK